MQYYFVLLLVAAVSGQHRLQHVQPISGYVQHPLYNAYNPYIYHHAPAVVSALPAVSLVPAAPVVAPVIASVKDTILTDKDHLSTTLVENAPLKPVVKLVGSPLVKFVPAVKKVVEAKEVKVAAIPAVVAAAPLSAGYVAITPGAVHQAPLPVGPSGDGFYASHHINHPDVMQTKLSRNVRSVEALSIVKPEAVYAHHVPAHPHLAFPSVAYPHSIAYPHSLAYPYSHSAFPFSAPVIDTPYLKTLPVKSVAAPVPVVSHVAPVVSHVAPIVSHVAPAVSHVAPVVSHVAPVVSHVAPAVKVEVAQAAPGYVAVNAGAIHKAPLPVGPSGDGFYASHHVNL